MRPVCATRLQILVCPQTDCKCPYSAHKSRGNSLFIPKKSFMKIFNIQSGPRRTGELIGARSIARREKVLNLAGQCPALRATARVSGRINAAMTLIEVLIVLAVLMILAAIFLPAMLQPGPQR